MSRSHKTKSTQTTNQVQTDTPTVNPFLDAMYRGAADKFTAFGNSDANDLVAGPSALQTKAFDAAGGLGGWQSLMAGAQDMAKAAGGAGANLATSSGYNPILMGNTALGPSVLMGNTALGPMAHISASTIDGMDRSKYMDPYLNDVVNTTMADFDENAGQTRAAQAAQAGLNGGFRSSRFGLREAQTEGNLARARAATAAGLRSNAFDKATGMMQFDAGQTQNAAGFNAGADNQRTLTQGQLDAATAAANAAAQNQRILTQGQLDAATAAANAAAQNQASQFGANASNQASMFNANQSDNALQRMLSAAGLLGNQATAMGEGQRSDLASMLGVGNTQYAINQAQKDAKARQLQLYASLMGSLPVGSYTSRTGTMNGTTTGTSTSKTSNPMSAIQTLGALGLAPFTGGASLAGLMPSISNPI
jgi:hypothetical protein